jgi:hypothetical protein
MRKRELRDRDNQIPSQFRLANQNQRNKVHRRLLNLLLVLTHLLGNNNKDLKISKVHNNKDLKISKVHNNKDLNSHKVHNNKDPYSHKVNSNKDLKISKVHNNKDPNSHKVNSSNNNKAMQRSKDLNKETEVGLPVKIEPNQVVMAELVVLKVATEEIGPNNKVATEEIDHNNKVATEVYLQVWAN